MAYLPHFTDLDGNSQRNHWLFSPNGSIPGNLKQIASEITGYFVATAL